MSEQQLALYVESPGNGEWKVRSRDIPNPGPGEVLVKIHATALNPVDWKIRSAAFFSPAPGFEYPAILGSDAAGSIAGLGEGVTKFAEGDAVLCQGFFHNNRATFQQYLVVPADLVAKMPPNISFDQAASVPLGLATAVHGFYGERASDKIPSFTPPWEEDGLRKYSDRTAVVFGGSTSVGQYATQLARLSGFNPIIVTASPHNEHLCRSLGATHVIDRSSEDIVSEIQAILGGKGASVIYDSISVKLTQEAAWEIVAPEGLLVLVLPPLIETEKEPTKHIFKVTGNVNLEALRKLGVSLYSRLTDLLAEGNIVPNRVEVLPDGLNGIPAGLKRMQDNEVSGFKLIAHPLET